MGPSTPFKHRAAEAGLTAQRVGAVVMAFYDSIRRDAVLGPIFEAAIGADWDAHIARIIRFWLTATRLGDGYDGRNFLPAHVKHLSIRADHLPRWLALFRRTAAEQCPGEAATVLIDIAERMAETLEISLAKRDRQLFDRPGETG